MPLLSSAPLGGVVRYPLPEIWVQNNVAASQTDVDLFGQSSTNFDTIYAVRAGSVVGITTRFSAAVAAGTATIQVTINGAASTISVVSTSGSNSSGGMVTQFGGVDTYAVGDTIGVQITTTGTFAPTTTDVEVWVQVQEEGGGGPYTVLNTLAIGTAIGSSTPASLLYVGTGNVLAQDASNLVFDATNKRLGLGLGSPVVPVHVKVSAAGLDIFRAENTSATGFSSLVFYNHSAVNKGSIGHDNANGWNYWDNATSAVTHITGNSATDGVLSVRNLVNTGYSGINFYKTASSTFAGSIGHGNTTVALTHLRNLNYIYNDGTAFWVVANQTDITAHFDTTNKRLGIGQNAAPSYVLDLRGASTASKVHVAATTGDDGLYLIASVASQAIMAGGMSWSGAAWVGKATTCGAMETITGTFNWYSGTSVVGNAPTLTTKLYITAAGDVAIGNANQSPGVRLDIRDSTTAKAVLSLTSTSTSGYSSLDLYNSSSVHQGALGYANAATGVTNVRGFNYFYSPAGQLWTFANGTTNLVTFGTTTNSAYTEWANGGSVAVSTANTGRLRYNTTGQIFQVSLNSAAYAQLPTGLGTANTVAKWTTTGNLGNSIITDDGTLVRVSPSFAAAGAGTTNTPTSLISAVGATAYVVHPSSNWGLAVARAVVDAGYANILLYHTRNTDASVKTALTTSDGIGRITFAGATDASTVSSGAEISGYVDGTVSGGVLPTGLLFASANSSGVMTDRLRFTPAGLATITGTLTVTASGNLAYLQLAGGDSAAVGDASTARLRYNVGTDKLQVSKNGAAYVDII